MQSDKCVYSNDKTLVEVEDLLYCKELTQAFLPLTLSNDNMDIKLEVDSYYRYAIIKNDSGESYVCSNNCV